MVNEKHVLGTPKKRKEVLDEIYGDNYILSKFEKFSDKVKDEFINFCMGNRGLKIAYDPFFKYIFNPGLHPERLSEMLSLILQQQVEVVEVLPNESDRISQKDSLLIMDIIVRTESGELINVEIQRSGYLFQGQRASCYSADLLMREMTRKKLKYGEDFKYSDMKKVYTIVLVEQSTSMYKDYPEIFIHRGKVTFDSGLNLEMLQEYIIIPLDVFKEMHHNELNKLEAWLYFISSDAPRDIGNIVEAYPEFKKMYGELAALRFDARELIGMYDVYQEALQIADRNTVKYMYEIQQEELNKMKAQTEELQAQKEELQAKNEELRRRLAQYEKV